MPKRLGQSASSLFRRTEPGTLTPQEEGQPAPPKARLPRSLMLEHAEEASEKVTFLLTPSQSMYLDELCFRVKRATGYDLARTEIVRAMIKLLMGLTVDEAVTKRIQELRRRSRTDTSVAVEQILVESIAKCLQKSKKG